MRRLHGYILLLSMVAPVFLTMVWLQVERHQIREAVKQQVLADLPDEALEKMLFSDKEIAALDWEDEHEFSYQGQMYDVVRKERKGNFVILYCWLDKAETHVEQLLDQLYAQLLQTSNQHQQRKSQLLVFLSQLYCQPIVDLIPRLSSGSFTRYGDIPELLSGYAHLIDIPPRRF